MSTPVYDRVTAELARRGRSWPWLYERMGYTKQRVGNWKNRDIPAEAWPAVAAALNESIDWVAGLAPPRGQEPSSLSPMAIKLAQQFDQIGNDRRQLDAFAEIIAVIARARGI